MIKFIADKGERKMIGFGLSRGNIDRLTKGQPIHLWLDDMGLAKMDLLIFFGETEEDMQRELAEAGVIKKDTQIHVDPKLRS